MMSGCIDSRKYTLSLMKHKTKNAIIICISILAVCLVCGALCIRMPYVKIGDLDFRYSTISKGMNREQVIQVMGKAYRRYEGGLNAWWDDELLGEDDDARVSSAIRYTVKTFFLPVSFEFTFDETGVLVGRHRYD